VPKIKQVVPPITIAVVGPHYSGKSSLCGILETEFGFKTVKEEWWKDPYRTEDKSQRDYFRSQMWFLTQTSSSLQKAQKLNAQGHPVVLDTFYYSTLIFGETKLSQQDFTVFKDILDLVSGAIPLPDLVIYLHADPEFLFSVRKAQRVAQQTGPKGEENTPWDWYQSICHLNDKYFSHWDKTPLFRVDTQVVNVLDKSEVEKNIIKPINELLRNKKNRKTE